MFGYLQIVKNLPMHEGVHAGIQKLFLPANTVFTVARKKIHLLDADIYMSKMISESNFTSHKVKTDSVMEISWCFNTQKCNLSRKTHCVLTEIVSEHLNDRKCSKWYKTLKI